MATVLISSREHIGTGTGETMAKITREGKRPGLVGRDDDETLTLPDEFSEPKHDLLSYSWFLFGEKKIGKTSLLSQFDDTIFLMFEPGAGALRVKKCDVRDWKQAMGYTKLLREDSKRKNPLFKNVVVDIVDVAYRQSFEYTCQKLGITHPGDVEDYGSSWNKIRERFAKWVEEILSLNKGVWFISHAKFREFTRRDGSKYDILAPTLTGQALEIVSGMVDSILYYGYDGEERQLVIRGDESIDAGTRLDEHFLTKIKGRPVQSINMGHSKEEAYANLVAAFNNKLMNTGNLPTVRKLTKGKKRP